MIAMINTEHDYTHNALLPLFFFVYYFAFLYFYGQLRGTQATGDVIVDASSLCFVVFNGLIVLIVDRSVLITYTMDHKKSWQSTVTVTLDNRNRFKKIFLSRCNRE